ncbi:MAG: alkaline phosphatase D family protein [Gammaproteobacteria bacterium]|nr:alkaline phosphatase D family protein [Gammaproteobacteria bacterium]MDH3433687.1 alkaline phosphatase D family protein [Gammaproteobacteria bacterium]
MLRRRFVQLLVNGLPFAALATRWRPGIAASPYAFRHGIASGDPLADGFIIWTRISGANGESVDVDWQVAADAGMQTVLQSGRFETDARRDYTVKVDVRGLPSGTPFCYRFVVDGVPSPVGCSRTLPVGEISSARFAVVSCASYPTGYFHVYREIAERRDLDAVIHLGDYLYEYGIGEYATEYAEELGRMPEPSTETISLADYRLRHAQYKTDPDLQALHAQHPLIAVWDDHEIANDCWRGGGENHDRGEGRWARRRNAAIQAYFEWMPIRGKARGKRTEIFRQFRYGDLLSLIMLDTRVHGRDKQPQISPDMPNDEIYRLLADPGRRLLGRRQERWLQEALARSEGTVWQLVGQQVLVSPVRAPDLEPLLNPDGESIVSREILEENIAMSKNNPPLLLDTWDGYAAARESLLADLKDLASNAVVISGDLHTSIAADLHLQGDAEAAAVEFMTTSVTSPGFADYLPERHPGAVRDATLQLNPNLRYMETDRRGWLCLTLTTSECTGEWHLLDDVRSRTYTSSIDRRLSVRAGQVSKGLYPG